MNYRKLLLIWTLCPLAVTGAIADADSDFAARRLATNDAGVFRIFDTLATDDERRRPMEFLYSYMALPDLVGYPDTFHLNNVEVTLKARREMPWGKSVPEREWLHFVLPLRVNNEGLDNSRSVFYEMLRDRVKGLSMKEAILEVNHWCHEKVTYRPSDARTSPPLSTMSQAIGRCGEESTFTVAALRAVGIPARQVYTPRWAHTDDNHAWVEAWADGQWYFLGACEPAPVLDMAWFNAPASRGMLMTTNVFGKYDGPEEKLDIQPLVTTINVTSKYAPVDTLAVKVVDIDGHPVGNATVNFSLYNYAEFYPVAVKTTDTDGYASLTAGEGDMVVWASDGKHFGWMKGKPGDETLRLVLDKDMTYTGSFDLTITPPNGSGTLPSPTAEAVAVNDRRLQYEDSVRNAYTSTFVTADAARHIASELKIDADRLAKIIADSRGNGNNILCLMAQLSQPQRELALDLLEAVTEKDRRDISAEVISDHVSNTVGNPASPYYKEYVLNPRIDTEELSTFRQYLHEKAGDKLLRSFASHPQSIAGWVQENINVVTTENPKSVRMTPEAVWRERRCDPKSRDIFFVALARTAGIPARIDPVTSKTQILPEGSSQWIDAKLSADNANADVSPKGKLELNYEQVGRMDNPKYYYQFTLSRIADGRPQLLEYPEGAGVSELKSEGLELDAGQYMLLSGQRMADGSVLAHGEVFAVAPDSVTRLPLTIRQDPAGVQVIGSLNAENIYHDLATDSDRSILSTTGRGYYVLGIIKPSDEPSAHALNDISALRDEFERWGGSVMVMFADADAASRFDFTAFANLPSTVTFGIDNNSVSLNELMSSLNLSNASMPIFVVADSFNRVVFVSQGYTIGLGDKIADVISKVRD